MLKKTAAIVISYNPNKTLLCKNIEAFINDVDIVLIQRNSDDDMTFLTDRWGSKIKFIGDGNNQYIAKPLNAALKYCHTNGYDWLLTMDQDSVWEIFSKFVLAVRDIQLENAIIFAPNVNNKFHITPKGYTDVESVITSGSLVNVSKALTIGGFNEKYEIYWVDGEFCYRARKTGFRIVMLPQFNLRQQFGNQTKTLFGFTTSNYSPLIYYYLIRNMLWEHREHGNRAVSMKCIFYTLMYITRGIILGENDKLKKLYAIAKGIWHGVTKSYR